jgi:glycosyltransferase involved in cell wall biosynthesis
MQVVHFFPPDAIAGVERYTQRLAAELVRSGDTVSIVTRRDSSTARPERSCERLRDGTAVYRFAGGDADEYFFLRHHEHLEQLFTAALVEVAPDVVHVNHLARLSPRFLQIARRHGAAVVLTLHDYFFACPLAHLLKPSGEFCHGPDGGRECARTCYAHEGETASLRWGFRAAYFRRLLALADRIIAPSRYLASFFENYLPGSGRIDVIPNGVPFDVDARPRQRFLPGRPRGQLRLAFLGIVTPHKGVHVILDALAVAGLENVDLVAFGRVPSYERAYCREIRQKADAISGLRFRMYGSYQSHELDFLLSDLDCVVVPSQLPENYPLVTQESLARGIPIVASRLGGIPEIVKEGVNGYTFDHRRPDELAAILRRLATEEELLDRLHEGALATPVMTVSTYTQKVRRIYAEAIEAACQRKPNREDTAELSFLHNALLQLQLG